MFGLVGLVVLLDLVGKRQPEENQAKKTAASIGETIMQNLGHLSIIGGGISFVFLSLEM